MASHAWGCSVLDDEERRFGKHEKEAENCDALCSGSLAGEGSEWGTEEEYPGLAEVAAGAVFGFSAGVHFADVHFECVVSCSLSFVEMLKHVMVVHCGDEVQGSPGDLVEWAQGSCELC